VEILSDICDPSRYTFDSFARGRDHGDLAEVSRCNSSLKSSIPWSWNCVQ
jgi:hypothetical protein